MPEGTNIRVSDETWMHLNRQKRPGESFDDVLQRLLEMETETAQQETDESEQTWRERLRAELAANDVPEARRDDVERLAELLRSEERLGYSFAVDERGVVTEWEWQQSKDHLAATSLVEHPDQRTWRWVGPGA